MNRNDRTVHGMTADGGEIVRYDRAGKWYVEWTERRRLVSVRDAAHLATEDGACAFFEIPGGRRFDAEVWRRLDEQEQA